MHRTNQLLTSGRYPGLVGAQLTPSNPQLTTICCHTFTKTRRISHSHTYWEFLEIRGIVSNMVDLSGGPDGPIEHGFSNSVFIIPGAIIFGLSGTYLPNLIAVQTSGSSIATADSTDISADIGVHRVCTFRCLTSLLPKFQVETPVWAACGEEHETVKCGARQCIVHNMYSVDLSVVNVHLDVPICR